MTFRSKISEFPLYIIAILLCGCEIDAIRDDVAVSMEQEIEQGIEANKTIEIPDVVSTALIPTINLGSSQLPEISDDQKLMERVVKAATGLTETEAENVFAKAIVNDRRFDYDDISSIISEKKQIIRKSGILEYYDHSETISNVGGLGELKAWFDPLHCFQ